MVTPTKRTVLKKVKIMRGALLEVEAELNSLKNDDPLTKKNIEQIDECFRLIKHTIKKAFQGPKSGHN